MCQLILADGWMMLWSAVHHAPEDEHYKAQQSRGNERCAPTIVHSDVWDGQCGDDDADVRTCIEKPSGQRPLFAGKPLSHGLHCRREMARFSQTQHESRDAKPPHRPDKSIEHARQTPYRKGQRESFLSTDAVYHIADNKEPQRVGRLEGCIHIAHHLFEAGNICICEQRIGW